MSILKKTPRIAMKASLLPVAHFHDDFEVASDCESALITTPSTG